MRTATTTAWSTGSRPGWAATRGSPSTRTAARTKGPDPVDPVRNR
jgi:hypothetical protein